MMGINHERDCMMVSVDLIPRSQLSIAQDFSLHFKTKDDRLLYSLGMVSNNEM